MNHAIQNAFNRSPQGRAMLAAATLRRELRRSMSKNRWSLTITLSPRPETDAEIQNEREVIAARQAFMLAEDHLRKLS